MAIILSEDEQKAADIIDACIGEIRRNGAIPTPETGDIIATNTRHEGKTAKQWHMAWLTMCELWKHEKNAVESLMNCGTHAERCGNCIACLQEDAEERDVYLEQYNKLKLQVEQLQKRD